MNLYLATALFSALLIAAGAGFFFPGFKKSAFGFLRSQTAAYVLGAIALAWFVWLLWNLSEADFGNYKMWLIALFGGAGLLSFKYIPDFLSVRALAVIVLLSMRQFLDAAFLQEPSSRLVMVVLAYAIIVIFIWLGCLPYKLRDFFEWLYQKPQRPKVFASVVTGLGLASAFSMLFY